MTRFLCGIAALTTALVLAGCGQTHDIDSLASVVKDAKDDEFARYKREIVARGDEMTDMLVSVLRNEEYRGQVQENRHQRAAKLLHEMHVKGRLKEFRIVKVAGVLGDILRDRESLPETRRLIARVLGDFKVKTAVRSLVTVLGEETGVRGRDSELEEIAIESIDKIGELSIDILLDEKTRTDLTRAKLVAVDRALTRITKSLQKRLEEAESPEEFLGPVKSLGKIHTPEARKVVASLLTPEGMKTMSPELALGIVNVVGQEAAESELPATLAPEDRNALLRALKLSDQGARIRAAYLLARARDGGAKKELFEGLSAEEASNRILAVEGLEILGDAESTPALAKLLSDDDVKVRRRVALALERIGGNASRDPLVQAMNVKDQDLLVLLSCARALGKLGEPQAIQKLIALLEVDDSNVRVLATQTLVSIGKQAVPALIGCLQSDSPGQVVGACRALGALRVVEAVPAILRLVKLAPPQKGIPDAVYKQPEDLTKEDVPDLVKALGHGNSRVRAKAARLLAGLHKNAGPAVQRLIAVATMKDEPARLPAIHALGAIGPSERVMPVLIELLNDPDAEARRSAALALYELNTQSSDAAPALVKATADESEEVRAAALLALGPTGKGTGIARATLEKAISAGTAKGRRAAAQALLHWGQAGVPMLEQALKHPDPLVRVDAALSLARMARSSPTAHSALKAAMRGDDENVRAIAKIGLKHSKGQGGETRILVAMVRSGKPLVQASAIRFLRWSGQAPLESWPRYLTRWLLRLLLIASILLLLSTAVGGGEQGDESSESKEAGVQETDVGNGRGPGWHGWLRVHRELLVYTGGAALALLFVLWWTRPVLAPGDALLAAGLKSKAPAVRAAAALAIGKSGAKAATAIPYLCEALEDSDAGVRKEAAAALSGIGVPQEAALAALKAAANDGDPAVQLAANKALREIDELRLPSIAPTGSEGSGEGFSDADIKVAALWALGRIGDQRAIPKLIEMTASENSRVRWFAEWALARFGDAAAEVAQKSFSSLDARTATIAATRVAGQVGNRALAEKLVVLIDQADLQTRIEAAKSLYRVGTRRVPVSDTILEMLEGLAARETESFDDRELGLSLRLWCLRALGAFARPRSLPAILTVLVTETDAQLRSEATLAAGHVLEIKTSRKDPAFYSEVDLLTKVVEWDPVVAEGLKDRERICRQALDRLGNIGHFRAVPAILRVLRDPETPDGIRAVASGAYLSITGNEYEGGE